MEYDRCFESFDHELDTLPGAYAEPEGCLLLAEVDGKTAGCIGMMRVDQATCEMARLWVRPEFRGQKLGVELINNLSEKAISSGYMKMRLETIPERMGQAVKLYKSLGFSEVDDGSGISRACAGTLVMEKSLT